MRRDALILLGLFALLVAAIALGPARVSSNVGTSASSNASGPDGALALRRWLESLDYPVERIQGSAFAPAPAAALLIVLAPPDRYEREQAELVADWVAEGGTLIVAEPTPGPFAPTAALLDAFELAVELPPDAQGLATGTPLLQPLLGAPAAQQLRTESASFISSRRADLALLAGDEAQPVLVGVQHGEGYVFASSAVYPFTNAGIGEADNAAMLLNLLRRVPPGALVQFDEYHHGYVAEPSLRNLLLGTRWGWAALYAVAMLGLFLMLTGRRFGAPVPLRSETDRRSSGEYLESMAGLLRRARKSDYVREHLRASLKRRLARTYGLSPQQDDDAFLESLAEASPAQARVVGDLLARLQAPADERTLLKLVAEADAVGGERWAVGGER
jgi:Arc/MetJ-type ribon-helix-helix transcriptional regulator